MVDIEMRDTPEHWRQRAQGSRADAARKVDPDIKTALLEIAALYERLAALAEKRMSSKAE
jgi:hypothetical protein